MVDKKELKIDDLESMLSVIGVTLGEKNCDILREQLKNPTEDIVFEVADFSSFNVKNPLFMTAKKSKDFTFSIIDIFTEYNKNSSLRYLLNNLPEAIKDYVKICGKEINVDDENDNIYQCSMDFLTALFMGVVSLYFDKKKSCRPSML